MEKQMWDESEKRGRRKKRRERVRRKKVQVREKVEKSRSTVFFQCFVPLECRAIWADERSNIARGCGAKQIWKLKS
jgi:hypothetical protein